MSSHRHARFGSRTFIITRCFHAGDGEVTLVLIFFYIKIRTCTSSMGGTRYLWSHSHRANTKTDLTSMWAGGRADAVTRRAGGQTRRGRSRAICAEASGRRRLRDAGEVNNASGLNAPACTLGLQGLSDSAGLASVEWPPPRWSPAAERKAPRLSKY